MFETKGYQKKTLAVIRRFLELAQQEGPEPAYRQVYEEETRDGVSRRWKAYQPVEGLPAVPYACLRLPTGGGKTLLAAHSIGIAADAYLERDYPLVLWLVPTNTIRTQTIETLQKTVHPNREALDRAFNGRVRILDISNFTELRPQDLRDSACIIVGTLATLRVKDKEGRKVYAHNEDLEPHFSQVPQTAAGLDRIEEGPDAGKVKFSFRNLIAINHPLVLIDEAHNASSPLSTEVLQRANPACVIEFTATPAANSNILHSVSASELKAEEMIKLPIILTEHATWQEAIRDSILTRDMLAEEARLEGDFVRPIVLIQAEDKNKEVTFEVVRQYLIEQERIPPEAIAIATGTQRELDKVNLMDPANKVEYVITVEALKEGWDCPFAYVFCSVATVHSPTAVQQLLGRILRMPYAKRRSREKLNRAYAHVSSTSWPRAVSQLEDRLVSMGFDQQEALLAIQTQESLFESPGRPEKEAVQAGEPLKIRLEGAPEFTDLNLEEYARISIVPGEDDQVEIEIRGEISPELERKIVDAAPAGARQEVVKSIATYRKRQRQLSPAEKGESFIVPQLCLLMGGELELAEKEIFLAASGWSLLKYPAELSEIEFTIEEETSSHKFDVDGKRLVVEYLGGQTVINLNSAPTNWTELDLSRWLDAKLGQPDIRQEVLLEFIRRTLNYLISRRGLSLTSLVRLRYRLEKALEEKIKQYRQQASKSGYQNSLFGPEATVKTSYDYVFGFDPDNYPTRESYEGSYRFSKHFYPRVGELDSEGEEFDCAKAIETCAEVKHWVRNVVNTSGLSFRLPTSSGYFYPDFVVELKDGRIMVIEYKGAHLVEGAKEKQNIGELWEAKSRGKGLFLMATKRDEQGRDVSRQIEDKIKRR